MQVILFALATFFILSQAQDDISIHQQQLDESWQDFKAKYNKSYSSEDEEVRRKQIFTRSLELITRHNLQSEKSFKMNINTFSDLTLEEFKVQMNLKQSLYWNSTRVRSHGKLGGPTPRKSTPLPSSVDWRNGYVTKPLFQGNCGCCWAIAVVGAAEAINAMNTGQLQQLSSQNIIDCATRPFYYSNGCNGGYLDEAYTYIIKNGLADETHYPFVAHQTGSCKAQVPKQKVPIRSFKMILSENELARAVALGPVPVAIDADQLSFQMYSSGIYEDPFCSSNVNHAVLVVGYDADSWIIKNSWSQLWGERGFARIRRGKNMCGILTQALQPIF